MCGNVLCAAAICLYAALLLELELEGVRGRSSGLWCRDVGVSEREEQRSRGQSQTQSQAQTTHSHTPVARWMSEAEEGEEDDKEQQRLSEWATEVYRMVMR